MMGRGIVSTERLRRSILYSIQVPPAQFDKVQAKFIYLPPRQLRALDPQAMLVTGIRGAGKSFWWFALQQDELRTLVLPDYETSVGLGFGQGPSSSYPERDELVQMIERGTLPRLIWRTIIVKQIAPGDIPGETWEARTQWVVENPARVAKILRDWDGYQSSKKHMHIVLFDALDRTAGSQVD